MVEFNIDKIVTFLEEAVQYKTVFETERGQMICLSSMIIWKLFSKALCACSSVHDLPSQIISNINVLYQMYSAAWLSITKCCQWSEWTNESNSLLRLLLLMCHYQEVCKTLIPFKRFLLNLQICDINGEIWE